MKRVIIAAILLSAIIFASVFSYIQVRRIRNDVILKIDSLNNLIQEQQYETAVGLADDLYDYWELEEGTLVHYVRHSYIDEISKLIARLPALVKGELYVDFLADLDSIRWQIDHVWKTERPVWNNIL